ncbi:hypothetical protein Tco_0762701, partial [Tanacetum coccineum]
LCDLISYTVDIEYEWGNTCDEKAMHGCSRIEKTSVMMTFTYTPFKMETEEPVSKNAITGKGFAYASVRRWILASGNGGSSCTSRTCGIGFIMWTSKSKSLSSESESESLSDEKSE